MNKQAFQKRLLQKKKPKQNVGFFFIFFD